MREDLRDELLTLSDSLPQRVACPFCGLALPGWPSLAEELGAGAGPEARATERACPGCGSRVSREGAPVRFSDPYALRAMARALGGGCRGLLEAGGCLTLLLLVPLGLLLTRWWNTAPPADHVLVGVAAAALVLLPVVTYGPWRLRRAWRRHAAARHARLRHAGAGDEGLGEHLADTDRRLRQLVRQVWDREAQIAVLVNARDKLLRSNFRDRVAAYERAIALVDDQIQEREALLAAFLDHRRDLEALVAVRQAETALEPSAPLADAAELEAERVRLTQAVEDLQTTAEAEAEIREITGGGWSTD